jgi:hypothetical protein
MLFMLVNLAGAKEYHFASNLEASKTVDCYWAPGVIEWTTVLSPMGAVITNEIYVI